MSQSTTADTSSLSALKQYRKLVRLLANMMKLKVPPSVQMDDLIQVGSPILHGSGTSPLHTKILRRQRGTIVMSFFKSRHGSEPDRFNQDRPDRLQRTIPEVASDDSAVRVLRLQQHQPQQCDRPATAAYVQ